MPRIPATASQPAPCALPSLVVVAGAHEQALCLLRDAQVDVHLGLQRLISIHTRLAALQRASICLREQ